MLIPIDTESERCTDCFKRDLAAVDHPANTNELPKGASNLQGYQVYQCSECGDYWGCRYQYDAGTGHDDKWHRFGPNKDFRRHY